MEPVTELFYDAEADVLYLSVGPARPAVSREAGDDVLVRCDVETGEVVGITVLNLSARFGSLAEPHTLPVTVQLREVA